MLEPFVRSEARMIRLGGRTRSRPEENEIMNQ